VLPCAYSSDWDWRIVTETTETEQHISHLLAAGAARHLSQIRQDCQDPFQFAVVAQAEASADVHDGGPPATPRCGHLPGATGGAAFNAGVAIFRDTPPAAELLAAWRLFLADPSRQSPGAL